jgi:hypothetical protein
MQSRHALGVSHEIGTVQQYMGRTVRYASKKGMSASMRPFYPRGIGVARGPATIKAAIRYQVCFCWKDDEAQDVEITDYH